MSTLKHELSEKQKTNMNTTTEEGQQKRLRQLADQHLAKSTMKGDWHWRKAAELLADDGDYIAGFDDGEGPRGADNFQ